MTNLELLLKKDYLSKETDYAIQIYGKWGIGKTFYYRQILEPLISETKTFYDDYKSFKPVYISLFGLNSIEEVATKIVLEFYQSKLFGGYLKRNKKVLKISGGILKMGLNGFLNSNKLGNVKDYLTDVSSVGKNVLDERELLICLDDLERRSKKLDLEDLLGYINSMVDSKIKILILANEETLIDESNNSYKYLKEKVIGVSIPFPINPQETITQIVKHKFANSPLYHKFLLDNISTLTDVYNASDNNYRHLSYALDRFHDCFSEIQRNIIDSKNSMLEILKKEYENLFKVFLIFSIEYKSSNLKFEDKYKFTNELISILEMMIEVVEDNKSPKGKGEKESSNEDFDFNYLKNKYSVDSYSFKLFHSFFDFITGISEFNIDDFIEEFCIIFHLNNGEVSPQYILLNRLKSRDCLYLSDEDYHAQINEMIEYAEKGKYFPSDYITVIGCIEAFNNPIVLNLHQVIGRIKNGLNKAIEYQFKEFGEETSNFKILGGFGSTLQQELYDFGKDKINNFRIEGQKNNIKEVWSVMLNDVERFTDEYFNNTDVYYMINGTGISENITKEQLIALFKTASLFNFSKLKDFFKEYLNSTNTLSIDRDLLLILTSELSKLNLDGQPRKKYFLDEIIKTIQLGIQ